MVSMHVDRDAIPAYSPRTGVMGGFDWMITSAKAACAQDGTKGSGHGSVLGAINNRTDRNDGAECDDVAYRSECWLVGEVAR